MSDLAELLDQLEAAAGPADPVPSADGWELVLAENIAYLADDRRRWQALAELRSRVGLAPEQILGARSRCWPASWPAPGRRSASSGCAGAPSWRSPGRPGAPIPASAPPDLVLAATALATFRRWIPAVLLLIAAAAVPWVPGLAFIVHLWSLPLH